MCAQGGWMERTCRVVHMHAWSTLVSTAINPRSRNHAPFVLSTIRNKRNRCNRLICGCQLVAPSSSHISLTSGRRSSARACNSSLLPEKGHHTPHNKPHATFPKQYTSFGNVIVYRRWCFRLIRVSDLYNVERFLRSRDRFVLPSYTKVLQTLEWECTASKMILQ